jgi:hypothetical protein
MPESRVEVLLAMQLALVGEVFPSLRQVWVLWSDNEIVVMHYIDGDPRAEDLESISVVETELIALFPVDVRIESRGIRLDYPGPIPKEGHCVYARREGY